VGEMIHEEILLVKNSRMATVLPALATLMREVVIATPFHMVADCRGQATWHEKVSLLCVVSCFPLYYSFLWLSARVYENCYKFY
jgi:hypothetical protein